MKKLLSLLLCLTVVASTFTVVLASDTVTIGTTAELVAMAQNLGADGGEGKTYKLTADIDFQGGVWSTYIGSKDAPFKGVFDGDGHVIKNIKYNDTGAANITYGLFGVVGGNGEIKNLGIENAELYCSYTGIQYGHSSFGGLIAVVQDNAKVDTCYAKNVTLNTKVLADVWSGFYGDHIEYAGGLIGYTDGSGVQVTNCYMLNFTEINDSAANNSFLIGYMGEGTFSKVENCYANGPLTQCVSGDASKVVNCYSTDNSAWSSLGTRPGTVVTADQLRKSHTTLGSAYAKGAAANDGFPAFTWEPAADNIKGEGTQDSPYLITNIDNFVEVATMTDTAGKYFKLTADIDMEGKAWSTFIGSAATPFEGNFDGNCHIIKNYKLIIPVSHSYDNWTFSAGIFGYVGGDAVIKNLGVENGEISSAVNSWRECAGAIAGIVDGNTLISNCYAKNITCTDITDPDMMALGAIAAATVGDGVVIENCYSISNEYREKVDYDSGIVGNGIAFSKIENCYSTNGIVRALKTMADKVVNCYNIGALGWPIGDTESLETYHGETISIIQLRALTTTLGEAYKAGGIETKGFPALKWETITEIEYTTLSTEVDSDVTDFLFETEFELTDDDEIIISFADKKNVDGVQILTLTDGEIVVGKKFNAGAIQLGNYKVVVDFDFSHKIILLTITLPDGSIYKRGDSELMCGRTRADVVSVSSINAEAIESGFVYSAKYAEAKEIVFEQEPQYEGFDSLVYNFVSSFDGDAKTTRNFAWTADLSFDAMDVMYKAEDDADWTTVSAVREQAQDEKYQNAYYYKADLTGLTPGTIYTYKYGKSGSDDAADWSTRYTFKTEDSEADGFNFVAVSDSQGLTWDGEFKYNKEVLDALKDENVNPAFVMHAGDVVEVGGYENYWQAFFKSIKDTTHETPFFFAPGNHDTWSDEQWSSAQMGKDLLFDLHLNHPNNGGSAAVKGITAEDLNVANKSGVRLLDNLDETVYSYNYGGAHFIVLNSGTALGGSYGYTDDNKLLIAQREWLIADLEANKDAKWTILMMHQPIYAQFFQYESKTVLTDIIDQYGIDLVLTGHDHSVSRVHAVKDGAIVDKTNIDHVVKGDGTVYQILGAVTPLHRNHISDYEEIYEENMLSVGPDDSVPVYTVVNVTDDKLEVTLKMLNGYVVDNYKIVADEIQITGVSKYNHTKVEVISQLVGAGEAQLNFYYNGQDDKDLAVMAGYYDSDNKLINVQKLNDTITTADENLYSYSFIPQDLTGVEEIKFFVWDTVDNLMPVAAKTYSLK